MKFKKPTILFKTVIGSTMWNQDHDESDLDTFEVYIFDSRSILLGSRHHGGHHSKRDNEDKVSYEIGHIIHHVQKGNINFLWGIMSPKIVSVASDINPNLSNLRKIVMNNLSKNFVHSTKGFLIHNLRHWFGLEVDKDKMLGYRLTEVKEPRLIKEDKKYHKLLNTCARTVGFGIRLLKDGILDFDNPKNAKTLYDLLPLLNKLEDAYEKSRLPERPDPKPFENFLLSTRLNDLKRL